MYVRYYHMRYYHNKYDSILRIKFYSRPEDRPRKRYTSLVKIALLYTNLVGRCWVTPQLYINYTWPFHLT